MAVKPITIIFGAGARVGEAVTTTFLKANYRVVRVSRSQKTTDDDDTLLSIAADLTDISSVESVFATVRQKWGEPSVVIYNAYGSHDTDMSKPLETFNVPTASFARAQNINIVSPFTAIREALASFQSTSSAETSGPKTFIFTGNMFNQASTSSAFLALGAGKASAGWMVESADRIYSKLDGKDIRFFYADERHEDGTPMFAGLGAQAHADAFLSLAGRKEGWKGSPWLVTFFAKGEGEGAVQKEFPRGAILPEGMI